LHYCFFNKQEEKLYWIHFIDFVCTKGKNKCKTEKAIPEEEISSWTYTKEEKEKAVP